MKIRDEFRNAVREQVENGLNINEVRFQLVFSLCKAIDDAMEETDIERLNISFNDDMSVNIDFMMIEAEIATAKSYFSTAVAYAASMEIAESDGYIGIRIVYPSVFI